MRIRTLVAALARSLFLVSLVAGSTAGAFECIDATASVDWLGVAFDTNNGPCPVIATVSDGSGVASARAETTGNAVELTQEFAITGASFFNGTIESEAIFVFEVGPSGAELVFVSSGSVFGTYDLVGPVPPVSNEPIRNGPVALPTAGGYLVTIRQVYTGGPAASPFAGSTRATLVHTPTVPVGAPVGVLALLALCGVGAFAIRERPG